MSQFPEEPLNLGYFPSYPGQKLNKDRYEIIRKLGYGPRSSVWMALDTKFNEYFAIKILTTHETFQNPSFELDASKVTAKSDLMNPCDYFTEESAHGSHLCLVLDVAGPSYEHLRLSSPTKSLARHIVQRAIACTVEKLVDVHMLSKCGLIHGAVTASNIVFERDTRLEEIDRDFADTPPCTVERKITIDDVEYPIVRSHHVPYGVEWDSDWDHINRQLLILINFGHAQKIKGTPTWEKSRMDKSLRPAEVILGLPYSQKVDIWMLGCTTYHLLTGKPLVPEEKAADDGIMLGWLIAMSGGPIPPDMALKSELRSKYFNEDGSFKLEVPTETLASQISSSGVVPADDIPGIVKFVQRCLALNPADRPSADDLLSDEWTEPGFAG